MHSHKSCGLGVESCFFYQVSIYLAFIALLSLTAGLFSEEISHRVVERRKNPFRPFMSSNCAIAHNFKIATC